MPGPLPPIPDPFGLPWDLAWPVSLFTGETEAEAPAPDADEEQPAEADLYREP